MGARHLLLFAALALTSVSVIGQDTLVKKAPLQGFSISGNYRFFGQHRFFTEAYPSSVVDDEPIFLTRRSILIGDATQLPELTLNLAGNPNPKTSFGTDLVVWNQNTGDFDYYRNLQLGVNLYGSFSTPIANVGVKAGGIHWHSMTPFTMRSFSGFNRFSLFERNPWDPQFKDPQQRYKEYHESGEISQDARWAEQAVQGIILDITELPFGLAINALYGKTQNAGSAFADLTNDQNESTGISFLKAFQNLIPNNVYAGRLIKTFGKHTISVNSFNRKSYSDLLAQDAITNNIHTTEFNLVWKKLSVYGELGLAQYDDVFQDLDPGEMGSLKIRSSKELTKIPMELHVFHISPNAINNNSEFVNTSIVEATSAAAGGDLLIGSNGVLQQTGSAMLGIGQMANNRQGVNLNTDIKLGTAMLSLGNGIAREIENRNSQVTFGHGINGLTISRFWRWSFPANVGPYNRTSVLYRGVFETVNLTDLDASGNVVNDKYFNNMEAQLKYRFNLLKRPSYLFYLGAFNSIQKEFSPITVFGPDAYVRYYSHQVENYYSVSNQLTVVQYLGWERALGSYDTQVDIDSERPINQEGIGVGLGLDYMIAKNTGLYVRHRYFWFEDKSFALDRFAGHESSVELKIFF